MSKTKKRTFLKRRKTKKNNKRRRKSFRNRKIIGGAGECPICLESKPLLKMVHFLDSAHPTEESESAINHEICEGCFMKLNPKKCPMCRRPVEKLINTDDNNVVWPAPLASAALPRGPPNITNLMIAYLRQFPPRQENRSRWTLRSWIDHITYNDTPFYQQFYDQLSQLPPEQLTSMYNNVFEYTPAVVRDLVPNFQSYYATKNKRTGRPPLTSMQRMSIDRNAYEMISFLAFILVVEVMIEEEYFNRIAGLFGW